MAELDAFAKWAELDKARKQATAGLTLEQLQAVTPAMIKAAPLLYEALKAYQEANHIHNDDEARLFDKGNQALKGVKP